MQQHKIAEIYIPWYLLLCISVRTIAYFECQSFKCCSMIVSYQAKLAFLHLSLLKRLWIVESTFELYLHLCSIFLTIPWISFCHDHVWCTRLQQTDSCRQLFIYLFPLKILWKWQGLFSKTMFLNLMVHLRNIYQVLG